MNNLKEKIKEQLRDFRYIFEALVVRFALWAFAAIKPTISSNIGSAIARFVGKKISVNKLAYKNISNALPNLSESEKEKIIDDMWDNLGRIVAEFSQIGKLSPTELEKFIEVSPETQNNINQMKMSGKGGVIVSAHIGNWEVGPKFFIDKGLDVSTVYRPLNNPYVEKMTANMRKAELIEKGAKGSRKIIEIIKDGGFVIILADQKISEGEPVMFFHDEAITTTSIARLALKYDVPLIPARVIRHGKEFKFSIEVEKPLVIQKTNDLNSDAISLTRDINSKLEEWIKQYPAQWFWVHNRWKK